MDSRISNCLLNRKETLVILDTGPHPTNSENNTGLYNIKNNTTGRKRYNNGHYQGNKQSITYKNIMKHRDLEFTTSNLNTPIETNKIDPDLKGQQLNNALLKLNAIKGSPINDQQVKFQVNHPVSQTACYSLEYLHKVGHEMTKGPQKSFQTINAAKAEYNDYSKQYKYDEQNVKEENTSDFEHQGRTSRHEKPIKVYNVQSNNNFHLNNRDNRYKKPNSTQSQKFRRFSNLAIINKNNIVNKNIENCNLNELNSQSNKLQNHDNLSYVTVDLSYHSCPDNISISSRASSSDNCEIEGDKEKISCDINSACKSNNHPTSHNSCHNAYIHRNVNYLFERESEGVDNLSRDSLVLSCINKNVDEQQFINNTHFCESSEPVWNYRKCSAINENCSHMTVSHASNNLGYRSEIDTCDYETSAQQSSLQMKWINGEKENYRFYNLHPNANMIPAHLHRRYNNLTLRNVYLHDPPTVNINLPQLSGFHYTPPDRFLARSHLMEIKISPQQLLNHSKWDQLSQMIWDKFIIAQQSESTYKKKMFLWRFLYICVKKEFPRFGLYLVGSTISGFGSDSSDVDMCLVSRWNPSIDSRAESVLNLNNLKTHLMKTTEIFAKFNLIQAKVPILRFEDTLHELEVDLNFNNCIGIRNTHLLFCYSQMDWRVRPLTLVIKLWAQFHSINNAKDSTISSYSLVLMVIHFLQCGINPPALPCLHIIYPNKFNAYLDIQNIDMHETLPPYESINKQPLGELLLNFLEYYANFEYSKYAISVRTGAILLIAECREAKAEKNDPYQWRELCIEEPFDLTNTARSVYDAEIFERIKYVFHTSYHLLKDSRDLNSIFKKSILPPTPILTHSKY